MKIIIANVDSMFEEKKLPNKYQKHLSFPRSVIPTWNPRVINSVIIYEFFAPLTEKVFH